MNYSFAVGQLIIKSGLTTVKTISNARNINVEYTISTHNEIGADGVVTDSVVEEESLVITAEWSDTGFDATLAVGTYFDMVLQPGYNSSGIAAITFARCRITGYSVRSAQGEFVICQLTMTKTGPIGAATGVSPTVQRVKFGSTYIGDSASVTTGYDGNVQALIIPTALGVLLRTTQDLGGGQISISVHGYVKKATRLELEQYLVNLYLLLSTSPGTLTVEYGLSSYTVTNCVFTRGSSDGGNKLYGNFTIEFLKSAY